MKDEFLKLSEDNQLVGSTLIVVNGNDTKELAYGYTSLENKSPMGVDTVFRIASISKTVAATGIMKLYEEGKIDLEADISDYLGFTVRNPHHPHIVITLKMIMTQTSSITDGKDESYNNLENGYNGVNGTNLDVSLHDLLDVNGKYFISETYDKELPGTHFIYSNFNCGIMACIIEHVTGIFFTDYIREAVLLPLGLDASFDIKDIKTKNIASLYVPEKGKTELIRDYEIFMEKRYSRFPLGENFRGPAGGLFISPRDLTVFMRMLMNRGYPIFKPDTIDLMLAKHWEGIEEAGYYRAKGLQVLLLEHYGPLLKGHFGDAYGVRSFMLFNEEKQIGIIYMTNGGMYERRTIGIDNVQDGLIRAFLDKYYYEKN
jgi:CubicO group peptidase (beta-lactamase class C family)